MPFTIDLANTPRCPLEGMPFTEYSFVRGSAPFEFGVGDIGVALVDLWNFGWEDGPVGETLGPELSLELEADLAGTQERDQRAGEVFGEGDAEGCRARRVGLALIR
jgi:hypothetical protein